MYRHPFRVLFRLLYFIGGCLYDWLRARGIKPGPGEFQKRAVWLKSSSAAALKRIGFGLPELRDIPPVDLIVCNHLSYLDIVVLASRIPAAFVSKAEVRNWPLLGAMATTGGTVYIRRERRADVHAASDAIRSRSVDGVPVVIFPEGTSSGGDSVLPFHSSLLDPAAKGGWRILPLAIAYDLDEGNPADEVCYWKDMTFFPHFLNLLSKKRVSARIKVGQPVKAIADRKELTEILYREVCRLHADLKTSSPALGGPR
ncbi:MAG TPA: lysophospholipid acyltransferase family protein [Candidatus Limnocylindria bacterium]|nr:lysophospholipid acyltransferase family protein [Candidatus Limnocylindria bacterium]